MANKSTKTFENFTFLAKDYDWPDFYLESSNFAPFNVILRQVLKESGIKTDIEYDYSTPLPSHLNRFLAYSTKEFPTALLKLISVSLKKGADMSTRKSPTFIIANSYFALTTDDKIKFYVPVLKQGYEKIEDALDALDTVIHGDLSHIRIIQTEHIDMEQLPKKISCKGMVWSPYREGLNLDSPQNKSRFAALIDARKEQRREYVQNILRAISKVDPDRMIVCCDLYGATHLFKGAEISTVTVDDAETAKISAKVILRNHASICVELEKFAKSAVDYVPDKTLSLKEALVDGHEVSITITQLEDEGKYRAILDEAKRRFSIYYDEEAGKASVDTQPQSDDANDEFVPDWDEE